MASSDNKASKWKYYQGPKTDPAYRSTAEIPGMFEEATPHVERAVPHITRCITPDAPVANLGQIQARAAAAAAAAAIAAPVPPAAALPAVIPSDIRDAAAIINKLPKTSYAGAYPSRNDLRLHSKLKKYITADKGVIRPRCEMRDWARDSRLFSADMWGYLLGEGRHIPADKKKGQARVIPATRGA